MAELALMVLRGEEVDAGIDLTPNGYQNLTWHPNFPGKVLLGTGWIVITAQNVDTFDW